MKTKTEFSPGSKVFAKVRGYPAWPARVEGCADDTPKKRKYHVSFYGTGETAIVKAQDVFDFVENRSKFGKLKKHKNFTDAMRQIEDELSPEEKANFENLDSDGGTSQSGKEKEEPAKLTPPPKGGDREAAKDTSDDDSVKDTKVTKLTPPIRRPSIAKPTKSSLPPAKTPVKDNKRKLDSDSSPEDPSSKKANVSAASAQDEDKPLSSKQTSEPISRAGRKIKPKKFSDFEEDGTDEATEETLPTTKESDKKVVKEPKKSRAKSLKESEESGDNAGDWYLLATKGKDQIKIPIKLNTPNFDDNKKRSMTRGEWEDMVFEEARALKKRIESGEEFSESDATDYMSRFTKVKADGVFVLRSAEEEEQFRKTTYDVESDLLDVEVRIRRALTLTEADAKLCLRQLDRLKTLRVTALMLKKHPGIVHTVRKLKRYIGDTKNWELTEAELATFNSEAAKIRSKAEEIINSFKTLFFQPTSTSFWDHFSSELASFNAKTKHMTLEDVFSIITEPE